MKKSVTKIVDVTEESVKSLEKKVNAYTSPMRKSLLKRFPVAFSLLVTFGVATTFLGFEQLVLRVPFLYERPLVMLVIGIGILSLTGTLYKKLG